MSISCKITVPTDHASFAGHFPGQPILPGVVSLSYALQAIERECGLSLQQCELGSVKFLHPVRPGDELRIELDNANTALIKFSIFMRGTTVATGTVKPL